MVRDMDCRGSSSEDDTARPKMSAVGKRHSKCPPRWGEGGNGVSADVNKGKGRKKATRMSLRAKDVTEEVVEKESRETESEGNAKKKGPAVARKRKSNGKSANCKNESGETSDDEVLIAPDPSPVKPKRQRKTKQTGKDCEVNSVDCEPKLKGAKKRARPTKQQIDEAVKEEEEKIADDSGKDTHIAEGDNVPQGDDGEETKVAAKTKNPAKNDIKLDKSSANDVDSLPQLSQGDEKIKVAAKNKKSAKNGCKLDKSSANDVDSVPQGDEKTKVAAKNKNPSKNDVTLDKGSTNDADKKVANATVDVGKKPAKPKPKRKKAAVNDAKKNVVEASETDTVTADKTHKDISPAKKKKLDNSATSVKSDANADTISSTNNTQDAKEASNAKEASDAKLALDAKEASNAKETSDTKCAPAVTDTKGALAGTVTAVVAGAHPEVVALGEVVADTAEVVNTEQSGKDSNGQKCAMFNSVTSGSSTEMETQGRTESEPKGDESEPKVDDEDDASRCFPCSHCPYRAKRKVQLRKHLGTHGVHQCAHCELVCDSRTTLTAHMQSAHPDKYGRKKCKRCLRIIKMADIGDHEVTCTGELHPWSCTLCGKEFKYECQLNLHARAHVSEDAATATAKTHTCPHCDYSAHVKANLAKHLKTVHGADRQKTVKCPECEKLFYTPSHMRKHLKLHSDDMPFACDVCAKAFRTARCLKRHAFVHTDAPTFACNVDGCERSFEKTALLKTHKLDCHQGADGVVVAAPPVAKPFVCSYPDCEQAFNKKSHLARHEVIHTGERKYVCDWPDCGKAFRHSDNLRVHYRRHTNEKPIKCDKCDFTCRQKSSLQFHEKSRHDSVTVTNSEIVVEQSAVPTKPAEHDAGTNVESEVKTDAQAMLPVASVATGIAADGIIRAAEMAPLVNTDPLQMENKASHDVFDFHDDDDGVMNRSIGLQIRQKTVGKSPPGGSLLNNGSVPSIRDETQHRNATDIATSTENIALANDTGKETTMIQDAVRKSDANMPVKSPDNDKSSAMQNDTPQTKAPSRKRKKKEVSIMSKSTDARNENSTAGNDTGATSQISTTTTGTATKKKAAARRSRQKKAQMKEDVKNEQNSDALQQLSLPECVDELQKEIAPDCDGGQTTIDETQHDTDAIPAHTSTEVTGDVSAPDVQGSAPTVHGGPPAVHGSAPDIHSSPPAVHGSAPDVHSRVPVVHGGPPEAVDDWPSSEPSNTVAHNAPGQLYEHEEYTPRDQDIADNVLDDPTEDMTEAEVNELLPSPATVSQLMSEKDVNDELSMPSLANGGSPDDMSVHSDFVNDVAMSPRTYAERHSPGFDGKEYDEREKELEAATAEAESAMFEMPAITSQDQTKIDDILDSQADLMSKSGEGMLDGDDRSPFMMPGSAGNAYGNAVDSRDAYSSYPVDAMSVDKKPLIDDSADVSQSYSGASSTYCGYPVVPERQSVLKSNPSASIPCDYSPPLPPQPSYQPIPNHALYGGRGAPMLPPGGPYSHVHNPSFLLDPNLLANGSSSKHSSEPAYVMSRDGPQLPVSSSSSTSSNKALPISSCFPGSEGYPNSAKDFFGQYFQDPSTLPLTHLPTAADQQRLSYHRAPHRTGFDFLPRMPGTAPGLPGAAGYPASVSESLAAAMNPAMNPQYAHAQPHWGVDDRSHPWAQPSPMLMATDLTAARNPFSASSSAESFDPSVASRQLSKRAVPGEPSFPPMPQPNAVATDPYSMTSAYMGRAFNPAAGVPPSNYMMNMSSSMTSTQKQFEEAYRQSAVAAAAHIADYRSLAPQAAIPDIYSRMGVNPALGLDKYYYSRREQMYRTQAIGGAPNPFLTAPASQTNATPVSYASDYSCAQVMYAAAAQHSAAAYGFMGDKQYLMSSRKISEAMPMLPERPPDYFPARPSTTEAVDPYRPSVIYNMMSRYY